MLRPLCSDKRVRRLFPALQCRTNEANLVCDSFYFLILTSYFLIHSMHRDHHRWYSHRLNRDMGVAVYGHYGMPILAFPTK
jgi:hypothetical protein